MRFFTTTRGSCSTTWPSPTPSVSETPLQIEWLLQRDIRAFLRDRLQFAGGDHLGDHHGGGLGRLDLLLAIAAMGTVLHHQHAERIARTQDRHAEEAVIDLLAGLRLVGEGRMDLCIDEKASGWAASGHLADERPLRSASWVRVRGFAVEPLRWH